MRRKLTPVFILILFSCVNHDLTTKDAVLTRASAKCDMPPGNMHWLDSLIKDTALQGDIYAVPLEGRIIFIHQPWIMSCLACSLYDCEGNRIDLATIDHKKLVSRMTEENLIYRPSRNQ